MTNNVIPFEPPNGGGADNEWRRQLVHARDGGLKDCRENVIYILRNHPDWRDVLAADVFAKRIVVKNDSPIGQKAGAIWMPDDDVSLGLWLAQHERLIVRSEETIGRSVAFTAKAKQFHPVREFLNGLKWDNVSRIDDWAIKYLDTEESMYVRRVGRYFLINMIRRAFEPGCIMRSVPVLEGPQDIGKSAIPRMLAQPWFADTAFDLNNKDIFQLIQGVWLYEVAELDAFGKAETTKVKAFVSSTKDRFRAPYDRAPQDQPRETCFIATTNAVEYLKDWTGNTRFWPLRCGRNLDFRGLAQVRDQILAEALAIYRGRGEEARSYPTRDEEARLFEPEQEERVSMHPWYSAIANYLDEHTEIEAIGVNDLLKEALHLGVIDMGKTSAPEQIAGRALARLKWKKRRHERTDGTRFFKWHRPVVVKEPIPEDQVPF